MEVRDFLDNVIFNPKTLLMGLGAGVYETRHDLLYPYFFQLLSYFF